MKRREEIREAGAPRRPARRRRLLFGLLGLALLALGGLYFAGYFGAPLAPPGETGVQAASPPPSDAPAGGPTSQEGTQPAATDPFPPPEPAPTATLVPETKSMEPPDERASAAQPAPAAPPPAQSQAPAPSVSPPASSWAPPAIIPPSPTPQKAPEGSGLVNGEAFGRQVYGIRPELLSRLHEAERLAARALHPDGGAAADADWGVYSLVGYRAGSRAHSSGRAVDINYYANPYIMHTKGEEALDRQLGPVYQRIARLMLGRDSVIPSGITQGTPGKERALRLYRQLREESDAMVRYFTLMRDRSRLASTLASRRGAELPSLPDGSLPTAETLQRQMLQDYVTLAGRPGPAVPGLEYPTAPAVTDSAAASSVESHEGDRPFAGDPRFRGPEMGFLMLREEVVRALLDAGILWGGTDMGDQSGDLMHFFIPASALTQTPSSQPAPHQPETGKR